jgi:uncharacterized protein
MRWFRLPLILLLVCIAAPASAQQFPQLTGRVVDAANLLDPAQEAELVSKLEALEQDSSRQLVVATIPSLEGREIEEYGYQLGRSWGIGQSEANNGTILIVAPNEKKVRIEVGYGLEPILTDALSSLIIHNAILPRFREGNFPGGIIAGADAIIAQLKAPPEEAEKRVLAAQQAREQQALGSGDGGGVFLLIFWGLVLMFVLLSLFRGRGGPRGRGKRRYGGSAWPIVLWTIANEMERGSRGRSRGGFGGWSGGGGFGGGGGWGGGGGGFSGGGGSFGGGGASGSW